MTTVNKNGFLFYWPDGSPFIEVFRKNDPEWAPFEVIDAGNMNRSMSDLNKLIKQSKEYAHEC